MKIKLISSESGDWEVLIVDNKIFHEGHRIPRHIWLELLENMGHSVSSEEMSDEDMERGKY